ncbi:invasion associated locus B family protein [Rhizobium leucaenae]|uniref:invasion associated locus B family protein n=1 Tax=Rhizobium leucaenae TaxID=29450 RepID=UPI003CCE68D7
MRTRLRQQPASILRIAAESGIDWLVDELGSRSSTGNRCDRDDSASSATMDVSRCTLQGCLVETNVENALLDAMKTKPAATVTVTTPDGKNIPIKLSLDGFPEAFAAMKAADRGK